MITLTYSPRVSWHSWHVSDFLKLSRGWFRRRGRKFYYVWVAELMKNGMVHFHVVVWMPKGYRLPKPDARGWWPHGLTRIEAARNPVGYPNIAARPSTEFIPERIEDPRAWWLRCYWKNRNAVVVRPEVGSAWCSSITDVRRMMGGGFVCVDTAEWRAGPWTVSFSKDQILIYRTRS